ncbi:MAG: CsgE family curli-type amyloid fiber assembly protein [Shewanella sp.]|uniref:CsgE family curli-type amyloid fiber assembly protein n=1 Tax=Shewanella sp. TaxID=50422 RepID=UPI003F32B155
MLFILKLIRFTLFGFIFTAMAVLAADIQDEHSASEESISLKPLTEAKSIDDTDEYEKSVEGGLILNRTMTRLGYNFYREFVSSYRDIGGLNDHSGLTVVEQATARDGSKISILHSRKPVLMTVVSPVSRNIEAQAVAAAKRIDQQLRQLKNQNQWLGFENPDLAPEEY